MRHQKTLLAGDAPLKLALGCCLALAVGCSAERPSDSFTFTADLPPDFSYAARAVYVPAKGETCTVPDGKNTQTGFNVEDWRTDYKPDAEILLHRTVSGCPLVLYRILLSINGKYGEDRGDFGSDHARVAVRYTLDESLKGTFDAAGNSELYGRCQWLFRTSGSLRRIVKILDCKKTDAEGNLTAGHPFVAYTLDQLPGKTVRLKVRLAEEERPGWGDTWVKVHGGWKRCMGDNFEDQSAYCNGNYKNFSTFRMPDGRDTCTIYPGCTEDKDITP